MGLNPKFLRGSLTDMGVAQNLERAMRFGQRMHCRLVTYRKDGTPFVNLLTAIPVWEPAPGARGQWVLSFYVGIHFVPDALDGSCAVQLLALEAVLSALPVEIGT